MDKPEIPPINKNCKRSLKIETSLKNFRILSDVPAACNMIAECTRNQVSPGLLLVNTDQIT